MLYCIVLRGGVGQGAPVTIGLLHLGVDVEARVAQLGDLLGQQLHAVHGVAEDNGLKGQWWCIYTYLCTHVCVGGGG